MNEDIYLSIYIAEIKDTNNDKMNTAKIRDDLQIQGLELFLILRKTLNSFSVFPE